MSGLSADGLSNHNTWPEAGPDRRLFGKDGLFLIFGKRFILTTVGTDVTKNRY
jgi:hypothetical protein